MIFSLIGNAPFIPPIVGPSDFARTPYRKPPLSPQEKKRRKKAKAARKARKNQRKKK